MPSPVLPVRHTLVMASIDGLCGCVVEHDLDAQLRHELHLVFGAAVVLRVAALPVRNR